MRGVSASDFGCEGERIIRPGSEESLHYLGHAGGSVFEGRTACLLLPLEKISGLL